MSRFLTYLSFVILLASCSQYSRRPAAVAFHNLNAKYNAIWQAERIEKDLQKSIKNNTKENYRNLLPIILLPDSLVANSNKESIDKIIKKASLVIDRHQNSAYIDDAYFLIGRGRVYQADWKNAAETFKYVNSIDPDKSSQVGSLIYLFKIYVHQNEFQEAEKVNEYLATFSLTREQRKDIYLINAWAFQKKKQPVQAITLLEEALPLIANQNEKARIGYILGQLYFLQNNESKALGYFEQVSKVKSNYDLSFQSNLAISQIKDEEPALLKMLKEAKNEEYKPHIYVALGQIYYQKNDFEKAKEYWKLGAKNADQKGELYLQLGHLFAKQFRKPKEAIAYYDSAVIFLPVNHAEYPEIKILTDKWKKFDTFLEQIQTSDSLLKLAGKSDAELKSMFDAILAAKKKDSAKVSENIPKPNLAPEVIFTRRQSSTEQQSFYFYNDMVRIRGEQEFVSRWGMRTLEDHWNRKTKTVSTISQNNDTQSALKEQGKTQTSEKTPTNLNSNDEFKNWLELIPRTAKQQTDLQKVSEKALFESGKFAKFELNDNDLAREQLQTLLKRFPQTAYEAESFYLLYECEVQNPRERNQYKTLLFEKYPDSHFKTLVLKSETGSLSNNKELEAKTAYETAYTTYKAGKYDTSFQQCLLIEQQFPGNNLEDKVMFLKILNKGAQKDFTSYENLLNLFLKSFPKSKLVQEAEDLLKTFQNRKQ